MLQIIIGLLSYLLVFNLCLLYLDDFKLSNNKYIRYTQILSPLLLLILIISLYYESISIINTVLFLNEDKNSNVSLGVGANVEIGKEAAVEISKGISSVGSNVGFAATVGAVTTGVAKVLAKSSLPPTQKAGIVVMSSLIGAGIHVTGSAANRLNNMESSTTNIAGVNTNNNIGNNISKFINDSANNNAILDLIFGLNMITYGCLSLIIILSLILLFKFFFNEDNIKLNLSSFIGNKLNNNINYYLIKIIKLNKND